MINAVKKSSSVYREELMAGKLSVAIHNKKNKEKENSQNEKQQQLEEEKQLLNKQKNLETQMKAESLIKEGTNRLEAALKSGALSEVYAANLLIGGGREKLTFVSEQQQQLTNELDKLRLKRKDAFLHEQSITKKMQLVEQN